MLFDANIYKDGSFWLAEIEALDAMTQGHTRKEAVAMLKDWIRSSLDDSRHPVEIRHNEGESFFVWVEPSLQVTALFLTRQRLKSGMTVRQAAHKLGFKSHNSYAQYEQGKAEPSLSQLQRFVKVLSPKRKVDVKVS